MDLKRWTSGNGPGAISHYRLSVSYLLHVVPLGGEALHPSLNSTAVLGCFDQPITFHRFTAVLTIFDQPSPIATILAVVYVSQANHIRCAHTATAILPRSERRGTLRLPPQGTKKKAKVQVQVQVDLSSSARHQPLPGCRRHQQCHCQPVPRKQEEPQEEEEQVVEGENLLRSRRLQMPRLTRILRTGSTTWAATPACTLPASTAQCSMGCASALASTLPTHR